jgi:myo-inositol-1(or 4)-monophosphatase
VPETVPPVFLATAIEAVIRAGDMQMAHFGRAIHVEKKGAIDLVTEIDRAVERDFRAMIARRFPGHAVLGEEFEEAGQRDLVPQFCWVIDPVDGTTNYAHGLPIFCSSLSLEIDGDPVVGAIYDPTRKELFTAARGEGAWLNGRPLRVSTADALIDSLLCTGFPYSVQNDDGAALVALFGEFLSVARAVRRLGSAALDLCYVAAGRFDGFWEMKLNPWDISAGALIVSEAAGRVSGADGGAFTSRGGTIVATNGLIHDQIVETIANFKGRVRSRNRTD